MEITINVLNAIPIETSYNLKIIDSNPVLHEFGILCEALIHFIRNIIPGLWCLTSRSIIFQLYCEGQYNNADLHDITGRNRSTRRKTPTCRKSLINFNTNMDITSLRKVFGFLIGHLMCYKCWQHKHRQFFDNVYC